MTNSILPQRPELFLTDGGLETTLIFQDGIDLPLFAAFTLIETEAGRAALRAYFERYIGIAKAAGWGFILEAATWRANPDWGTELGYSREALDAANRKNVELLHDLRARHQTARSPMLVSGCVGPRGDGYDPGEIMTSAEAEAYHAEQIGSFAGAGVDQISAITMTNVPEAIGVARAAKAAGLPAVISFTVETDGHLPTGQSLAEAISEVDRATDSAPAHYMINCAHPTHFAHRIDPAESWVHRIGGLRANASCKSHAELDEAETLDRGHPGKLASEHVELSGLLPALRVIGGCCGTDHEHIGAIANALSEEMMTAA